MHSFTIDISKSTKDRKNPKYENYVWYFEHLNSDKSKKSCLKENEVYRIDINGNPMMYELVRKLEQKFEEYKGSLVPLFNLFSLLRR